MEHLELSERGMEFNPMKQLDTGVAERAEHGPAYAVDHEITVIGQDAMLEDKAYGLFGVFDGMGGAGGNPSAASKEAALAVKEYVRGHISPAAPDMLVHDFEADYYQAQALQAMEFARHRVAVRGNGGSTTALFLRILPGESSLKYVFANAGDCRLGKFDMDKQSVQWLSTEQGEGNRVYNGLGPAPHATELMKDEVKIGTLLANEILFLCSDGVTGNLPQEAIGAHEFKEAFTQNDTMDMARRLIHFSKKQDDKSLIVIKLAK